MTETALNQAEEAAAASSSSKSKSRAANAASSAATFDAGDECFAKYSGDGKWYPARITSIGGADDRRVYSVVFKGYNSTELVAAADVKPLPPSYAAANASAQAAASAKKRKLTEEEEKEAARKKLKNEKRVEVRAQKAAEQNSKQAAWQKFAKKGEKKGVVIAGLQGKSIFQSPSNAHGRVGVTGSGKGMSDAVQRVKHKFAAT